MWRAAEEQDINGIEAFLNDHIQSSMFLLGNLRSFGLGSDHPYGLTLWVLEHGQGVFAINNSGAVLMQALTAGYAEWQAAARLLEGREVTGILGDAPQVRAFAAAAGLDQVQMQLDRDDLSFHLDLRDIQLAPRDGDHLVPLSEVDRALLETWRASYHLDSFGMTPDAAQEAATREIATYIKDDSHRVLISDGTPVAMTGFNVRLQDIVQIGGVFTPAEHRRQGHARHAVARHLVEVQGQGITQAVLFAANEAAATAYRAVGFKPAGKFALMLFQAAQTVRTENVEART